MTWHKKGLIYELDRSLGWAEHSASKPAPIVLDEKRVRVFVGCRDGSGVSRIGFVDLDANDPSRILRVSPRPVLDIGTPGMFDDNGVVPCVAVRRGSAIYLYYEGYQLGTKVSSPRSQAWRSAVTTARRSSAGTAYPCSIDPPKAHSSA